MKKSRETFRFIVKLALGAVLVVYVLHSRMIDFDALKSILLSPINLGVAAFFFTLSAVCCALRWHQLSQVQNLSLSRFAMFELIMIGNFFNTFMPGSVGGDVVKAWYVAGREPARKMRAVFTMFLDRVIGLAVIVFYAACTLLFYTSWLKEHSELKWLAVMVWGFTGLCLLSGLLFFGVRSPHGKLAELVMRRIRSWAWLHGIVEGTLLYRHHLRSILYAVALSGFSIFGMNLLYKVQGDLLGIPMDLAHYFFVVPVVMTVSALPLLPGGIGVGQVAFFKLFQWIGMSHPQQGSTLCTVMQIYTILFNCTGAFFYLKFKRQPLLVDRNNLAVSV